MDSKKIGFWSGIILFTAILIFFNPDDLSERGQITAAVFILMGIWWATEALPLPATALTVSYTHLTLPTICSV